MRILLDTHVWLWMLVEPQRIGADASRVLTDIDNELWLSAVSIWEALIAGERGRVDMDRSPGAWVEEALKKLPVRDAPLTREVALVSRSLDVSHEDLADRFIAASAVVHDLTLVTADRRLLGSTQFEALPAS